MTKDRGFYYLQTCFRNEEAGLLGCCAVWLGSCFPTLEWKYRRLNLWGCAPVNALKNLKMKTVRLFVNVGKKLPNHTPQQSRRPGSSTITRWETQITVFILLRTIYFWLFYVPRLLRLGDAWRIFYRRMKRQKFSLHSHVSLHACIISLQRVKENGSTAHY
jgi:hypothetical protein